ncbi:class I SAM-dependent methyltransferase [Pseudobacteriovorax antillogorgiicola]|uniref:Methyltransferase domain-containing protein n=1 Tax=Pseudobacteriovorax antillogorgiicola TaxID=1513793 RepID=A0A1Y6CRL9_9BACT|nr:class I SAM-dependent methyltransferase [Pseudobacteriovorax antillogorgiicola]TCS45423.1 methyltransferase family protein [Pseudobacteriovorax antillogorgiicola]SMF74151.1 Methyltransferase domain-containing protein [Pseudobacteriovorax antillogorgiicola]
MRLDPVKFNKEAWNIQVQEENQWTKPVSSDEVQKAANGDLKIVLTPTKPVPENWYPDWKSSKILALASAGGQQVPLMAAAGAEVTVFDNSPMQLDQDRMVAARDQLTIETIEGDMSDLSIFPDESFDFIFHPCSNCFVPDIKPVWRESFRVLKPGGIMVSGFCNPIIFTLDPELEKQGIAQLKYKIPYSDLDSISEEDRIKYFGENEPLSFGHSLQDQIGGQLAAGFVMIDFYEDDWNDSGSPADQFLSCYMATRCQKPSRAI